jgi:imidazolonepropionase-like amidohydrolase
MPTVQAVNCHLLATRYIRTMTRPRGYQGGSNGGERERAGDPGPRYVVSAGHAFDGSRFLPGAVQVLVDGGLIVAVQPARSPYPGGWPVIDRPSGTVLPGLIDTHVHLVGGGEADAFALDAGRSGAEREQVIRRSLQQHLEQGVTAVRDLGDTRWAVLDREAQDGEPSVVGSGPPITSPGGHCAAMGGEASGAAPLRALVAELHERGAQAVKIVVSGGAMTAGSDLLELQFGLDDVRLVVEEAHRRGLAVTAHAHSVPSVEVCIAAGADGIEHCTCLTAGGIHTPPALIDALAARGIQVSPTFGRLPGLPPSPQAIEVMRRTGMTLQARFEQVGALFAAGCRSWPGPTRASTRPNRTGCWRTRLPSWSGPGCRSPPRWRPPRRRRPTCVAWAPAAADSAPGRPPTSSSWRVIWPRRSPR